MADWADLTLADLEQMGLTIEDVQSMLENGQLPDLNQPDYGQLGILEPPQISRQADQWAQLAAYKEALGAFGPPSTYEQRQDRQFYMPDQDAFSYDIVNQANPYIRELLNAAISGSKPGPNQAFDVREYLTGKIQEGPRQGKTRLGAMAVTPAMEDFEAIGDQYFSDNPEWATRDPQKQRALLQQFLESEVESALAGGAPSVSRNVNWSDWALNRQQGEPFMMEGPGFDQGPAQQRGGGPKVQVDPRYFGKNVVEGADAQMSLGDYRQAYGDELADFVSKAKPGQRFEDPNGGYWQLVVNTPEISPLTRERARLRLQDRRRARGREDDERRRRRNSPQASGIGGFFKRKFSEATRWRP